MAQVSLPNWSEPSVQEKAKAAALQALRGRNPALPLSIEEKHMVRAIVQGVIDAEIANLEQTQQRCGDEATLAQQSLNTLQLSKQARVFLRAQL